MVNVLVKVGHSSDIVLNTNKVKLCRAVTMKEFDNYIKKGMDIVIIECIEDDEYNQAKGILSNRLDSTFFYLKESNSITMKLANELQCKYTSDIEELYSLLGMYLKEDISIHIFNHIKLEEETVLDKVETEEELVEKKKEDFAEEKPIEDIQVKSDEKEAVQEEPKVIDKEIVVKVEQESKHIAPITTSKNIIVEEIKKEQPHKIVKTTKTVEMHSVSPVDELMDTVKKDIEHKQGVVYKSEVTKLKARLIKALKDINEYNKEIEALKKKCILIEHSKSESENLYVKQVKDLERVVREQKVNIESLTQEIDTLSSDTTNEELTSQIQTFKAKICELEEEIKSSNIEISSLNSQIDDLKNEIVELEVQISEINRHNRELENGIMVKSSEIDSLENDKQTVNNQVQELSNNLELLKSKILEYETEISNNESEISKLELTISDKSLEIENEKLRAYEEITVLKGEIERIQADNLDKYTTLNSEYEKVIEQSKIKDSIIEKLNSSTVELGRYKDTLSDTLNKNSELESNLSTCTEELDRVANELSELKQKSNDNVYMSKISEMEISNREIQHKVDFLQAQLQAKETQYTNLMRTVGVDQNGANTILDTNKLLESLNSSLREQVKSLMAELSTVKSDNSSLLKSVSNLREVNTQLQSSVSTLTYGINSGYGVKLPQLSYNARGFILPVFGSGSYGTTTTAISLAYRLSVDAKVLFIDFDLVSPKADTWFNKSPLVKHIEGLTEPNERLSGLDILLNKPIDGVLNKFSDIVSSIKVSKGGYVDYLSGLYKKPDAAQLLSLNYEKLMHYCGSVYNYIVIDFGRLGSSSQNDELIHMITEIAYRNIVVTPNDKESIRNMLIKLKEVSIDTNNTAWLLNCSETTIIDEKIKRGLPSRYSIMTFNYNVYGKRVSLLERGSKDKFELFINKVFDKEN